MHGVEELLQPPPPYLFQGDTMAYTVTDVDGKTETVTPLTSAASAATRIAVLTSIYFCMWHIVPRKLM